MGAQPSQERMGTASERLTLIDTDISSTCIEREELSACLDQIERGRSGFTSSLTGCSAA